MSENENKSELIVYADESGLAKVEARLQDDNVWLSQKQIAQVFDVERSVVTKHIKNIVEDGELQENRTSAKFAHVQIEGGRRVERDVEFYNLDMILAVGYRVNSRQAMRFRQWATAVLHEYLQKGFALNDNLLSEAGGGVYWKQLTERIRQIRLSEKVFYRTVLDIYATSVDYDPKAPESIEFFKIVQNKMHWAVHQNTAAEVIYSRAEVK